MVIPTDTSSAHPEAPEGSEDINRFLLNTFRKEDMRPAPLGGDWGSVRRVYTDIIGLEFIGGSDDGNRRKGFTGLLKVPGYPCLSRTIVNRIRAHYFGRAWRSRGMVSWHPIDPLILNWLNGYMSHLKTEDTIFNLVTVLSLIEQHDWYPLPVFWTIATDISHDPNH